MLLSPVVFYNNYVVQDKQHNTKVKTNLAALPGISGDLLKKITGEELDLRGNFLIKSS